MREREERKRETTSVRREKFFKKGIKLIYNAKGTGRKQGHSKLSKPKTADKKCLATEV